MIQDGLCCVNGCERDGMHLRTFAVTSECWGEVEVVAAFCCEHFDNLTGAKQPYVDIEIHGRERV